MKHLRRTGWLRVTAWLILGLAACSSGGSGGVDASGSGGSGHTGSGGGVGAAAGGTGGTGGLGGHAGSGSPGGASAAGQSGSQGGGGAAGGGGSPEPADAGCNLVYDCPMGETCSAHNGRDFGCVLSGTLKAGDPCDVASDAAVECGDRLVCALATAAGAMCVQYCDATHPCPTGKNCLTGPTQADQPISICL
jgi:hypothetical protein